MKLVLIALLTALMFGCSGGEGVQCEEVSHDGKSYCVYEGAITETGYECPADLERLHRDAETNLVVCSKQEEPPPFREIAELLDQRPSNNPDISLPSESEQCIVDHADGTMLSDLDYGACTYGYYGPCEQVDEVDDVRQDCRDDDGEDCDAAFITRDAAICITRAAGLEAGEWPATARLHYRSDDGVVWSVSVLREVIGDAVEGDGQVWRVDASTGEILDDEGGFGWIN